MKKLNRENWLCTILNNYRDLEKEIGQHNKFRAQF